MTTKVERGKIFVTFKNPDREFIYLNIFLNDNAENNVSKLNNYVFKYINSFKLEDFFEYPILNNNASIQVKTNKENNTNITNLKVDFNKIDRNITDIIYSLKVAKKWDHSKDELNNTIALSNSPYYVTQISRQKNNIISMNMNDIGENNAYLEVIAQIKDGPIIEYVAYDPYYLDENYIDPSEEERKKKEEEERKKKEEDDRKKKEEEDRKKQEEEEARKKQEEEEEARKKKEEEERKKKTIIWIIVGIGGGILAILIVLIIFVVYYHSRSKDLLEQVNKISFAQDDKKGKNENLLLEENELK